MNIKYVIVLFNLLFVFSSTENLNAQQVYVGSTGIEAGLIILTSYGFPAKAIKTSEEVIQSKYPENGIVKRHACDRGHGSNPHVNLKVSPKFAIAPVSSASVVSWYEAAGWSDDVRENDNPSGTPALPATGCAAYRGADGTDAPGTWRLPTQHELLFIVMMQNQLKKIPSFTPFENRYYWSSTEYATFGGLYVNMDDGKSHNGISDNATAKYRCIRDL